MTLRISRTKNRRTLNSVLVVFLGVLVLGGLVWVNLQFTRDNPGGNDFLAHYVGSRYLIFEGKSPYSDEVALEIQRRVFGRPAEQGEIEHRVVYPIYSVLLFAPFALIQDYAIARVAWMTVLEVALLVTAYLALLLSKWKPKTLVLGMYFLFSVLWYHGFRSVINGNAVIMVGLLITAALYALWKEKYRTAGVLLAFSTIKPNLVVLVIFFVLVWCAYQKKKTVIIWFSGSMLVLTLGGMLLVPNWIIQNLWEILKYPAYNPPGSVGEVLGYWFPGSEILFRAGIAIILGLLWIHELWTARRENYSRFLWTVCLTLVISQWIGIATDPGNFVILFIPFVFVLARLDERWKEQSAYVIPVIMGGIFFGLWILFALTLDQDYQPMQSSVMFFPFPAIVLIGLYWIKWWVSKASTLNLSE
ncbi:MAG: hypothetical protein DRI65_00330 [Chloroflexota bacterium]|nr:MAG: hypothetical protein DRI65_00330 [Chloroflexota bacterium]